MLFSMRKRSPRREATRLLSRTRQGTAKTAAEATPPAPPVHPLKNPTPGAADSGASGPHALGLPPTLERTAHADAGPAPAAPSLVPVGESIEGAAGKLSARSWFGRRTLERAALLLPVAGIVATGVYLLAAAIPVLRTETLLIERIELPEAAVKAGLTPERVELTLQAALESMVNPEVTRSSAAGGSTPRSLVEMELANAISSLRESATEVSLGGKALSANRVAFWLAPMVPGSRRQSTLALAASQMPNGQLDVQVRLVVSDGRTVLWRTPALAQPELLDEHAEGMQQLAFEVLREFDPERAARVLLERDWRECECVSGEVVELAQDRFEALGAYGLLTLLDSIEPYIPLEPPSAGTGVAASLARLYARARQAHPQAPWTLLFDPVDGVDGVGSRCANLDETLLGLVQSSADQQLHKEKAAVLVGRCVGRHHDIDTLRLVRQRGVAGSQLEKPMAAFLVLLQSYASGYVSTAGQPAAKSAEFRKVWVEEVGTVGQAIGAQHPEVRLAVESVHSLFRTVPVGSNEQDVSQMLAPLRKLLHAPNCTIGQKQATDCLSLNAPLRVSAALRLAELYYAAPHDEVFSLEHVLQDCILAHALQPSNVEAWVCLGRAEMRGFNYTDALGWFYKALLQMKQPRSRYASPPLGALAREALRESMLWALYQAGSSEDELQRAHDEALRAAIHHDVNSDSARGWVNAERCKIRLVAWGPEQTELADRVASLGPLGPLWLTVEARKGLSRGNPQEARRFAAELVRYSRQVPVQMREDGVNQAAFSGHLLMGNALIVQRHYEAAQVALGKALALRPQSAEAQTLLAMAKAGISHVGHRQACQPLVQRYPESEYLPIVYRVGAEPPKVAPSNDTSTSKAQATSRRQTPAPRRSVSVQF